jgi:hypothetical protein
VDSTFFITISPDRFIVRYLSTTLIETTDPLFISAGELVTGYALVVSGGTLYFFRTSNCQEEIRNVLDRFSSTGLKNAISVKQEELANVKVRLFSEILSLDSPTKLTLNAGHELFFVWMQLFTSTVLW